MTTVVFRTSRRLVADPWFVATLLVGTAALTVALVMAADRHLLFGFADAASHVVVPRRVFDNAEPGLAQLGTHWAPLYHVLQLPFVWLDPLYRSGGSAIVVSAAATMVTVAFIYRLAVLVGADRPLAFAAAALLATTPSFAYSGIIPMLPATIMAATTVNIFYLCRWTLTGSGTHLVIAGLTLTAATLTHFDTWILIPIELCVIVLVSFRRWTRDRQAEATVILWVLASGYGLLVFALMNLAIFGDLLAFTRAFEGTGDVLGTSHHGVRAFFDYPHAAWMMTGPILGGLSLVGVLSFIWTRRGQRHAWVALLLLYPIAWYTAQAATTGSIIEPGDTLGDWRNLRYATTILPAAVFFAAVGFRNRLACAVAVLAVSLASVWSLTDGQVAAWEDARHDSPSSAELQEEAQRMARSIGDARVLIPIHHSLVDRFELFSGLPSRRFVDANDTKTWTEARRSALRHPSALRSMKIAWLVWIGERGKRTVATMLENTEAKLCTKSADALQTRYPIRVYALHRRCD